MIVNGKKIKLIESMSVLDFLKQENYEIGFIAVEKNERIVPKNKYDTEMLCDTDKIEIVQFVGGG